MLYLFLIYSITSWRRSWQKSISKSAILTLSGFKNLSNTNPNRIGSNSVIFKHHATNEPAPEPLPPVGILLFFAQLT